MKRALALVLALALLATTARTARADDDRLLLAQDLESSGRSLRTEGIVTTALGVGMLTVTTVLWLRSQEDCLLDCSGAKWILLGLGLPTTAFGITMWWLGEHDIHRAQRLRAWAAPTPGGLIGGVQLVAF